MQIMQDSLDPHDSPMIDLSLDFHKVELFTMCTMLLRCVV
jgi:hypothetical protein